jgi:hypothetical protein
MKHLRPVFIVLTLLATIPRADAAEVRGAPTSSTPAAPQRTKVDINTADIPALEAIPEIGTDFANAVVGARPFKSVDELDRILKIGPEKMAALKLKVMASAPKPAPTPPTRSSPDNLAKGAAKPSPINDGKAVDRKEVNQRHDAAERKASKEPGK